MEIIGGLLASIGAIIVLFGLLFISLIVVAFDTLSKRFSTRSQTAHTASPGDDMILMTDEYHVIEVMPYAATITDGELTVMDDGDCDKIQEEAGE